MSKRPRILVFQKNTLDHHQVVRTAVANVGAVDPIVRHFEHARQTHERAMAKLREMLELLGVEARFVFLDDEVDPEGYDLVVALGGDGTVLHVSHQIGATPVLAINSAPEYSVGFLTATTIDEAPAMLERALVGELSVSRLERMAVEIEGILVYGRVLNDVLFSHECPASTARYLIRHGEAEEEQMSSGIWVGPAAGSTAAQRAAGGKVLAPGSKRIQFVVREPYVRQARPYRLIKGLLSPGEKLVLRSMTDAARLYVDGPHVVLPVRLGETIAFRLSDEPLRLLGFRRQARPGCRPVVDDHVGEIENGVGPDFRN